MKPLLFLLGVAVGWWLADWSRAAQGKRMAALIDELYKSAMQRSDGAEPTCEVTTTDASGWLIVDADGNAQWVQWS